MSEDVLDKRVMTFERQELIIKTLTDAMNVASVNLILGSKKDNKTAAMLLFNDAHIELETALKKANKIRASI